MGHPVVNVKDHLVKGYSLNQKRLLELQVLGFEDLEKAIELVRSVTGGKALTGDEAKGLLDVITRYASSWLLLQQFNSYFFLLNEGPDPLGVLEIM